MGEHAEAKLPRNIKFLAKEQKFVSSSFMDIFALTFVFVLAGFLGFELITKIPSQLHTPLMSGSNAISGATIISALVAAGGSSTGIIQTTLALTALILATINVVGGYLITNKMLSMFQKK